MSRPPRFPLDGSFEERLEWRLAFDIVWVLESLFRIPRKKDNRLIPFRLRKAQKWVVWNFLDQEALDQPVRIWVLKGRQFGISTLMCAYLLVKTAFHGHNSLQLVHQEKPGRVMFKKIGSNFRNLVKLSTPEGKPFSYVSTPVVDTESDSMMAWRFPEPDGTFRDAYVRMEVASNENAGVSESHQHVHMTEIPLWDKPAELMQALHPVISDDPGTSMVGEFTARAEGSYAHKEWVRAASGQSLYRPVFLPWYWHEDYKRPRRPSDEPLSRAERLYVAMVREMGYAFPLKSGTMRLKPEFRAIRTERQFVLSDFSIGFRLTDEQMLWRRDQIVKMRGDVDEFRREYPATPEEAWVSSGRRVYPPGVVDRVEIASKHWDLKSRGEYEVRRGRGGRAVRVFRKRSDGRVWVFEEPQADASYVIGADTSSGTGDDYSSFVVWRLLFHQLVAVATFEGKERPYEFARILARVGSHYRCDASLDVASGLPSGGRPALLVVERNRHGANVLYELHEHLKYRRLYRQIDKGKSVGAKPKPTLGFPMTKEYKMPTLHVTGRLMHDGQLIIPCPRLRSQLRSVVYLDDHDNEAGAPAGMHDDLAMAGVEGAIVASQKSAFRRKQKFVQPGS